MKTFGYWYNEMLPEYRSRSWRGLEADLQWDRSLLDFMWEIAPRKCQKRLDSYLIPGELDRFKQSIRFGFEKTGHGYHAERGDFCLVAGVVEKQCLTCFYRSVEITGGLHGDVALFGAVDDAMQRRGMGSLRMIRIYAIRANAFCVAGNSNATLRPKLRKFYGFEQPT